MYLHGYEGIKELQCGFQVGTMPCVRYERGASILAVRILQKMIPACIDMWIRSSQPD